MKFITIERAREHCRADANDDALLTIYGNAAEAAVQRAANRKIFVDQQELDAAIAAIPAAMAAANLAYKNAIAAAATIAEAADREVAECIAENALHIAKIDKYNTLAGIVVNDDIISAALLMLGHFYRNREENVTGQGEVAQPLVYGVAEIMNHYRKVPPL